LIDCNDPPLADGTLVQCLFRALDATNFSCKAVILYPDADVSHNTEFSEKDIGGWDGKNCWPLKEFLKVEAGKLLKMEEVESFQVPHPMNVLHLQQRFLCGRNCKCFCIVYYLTESFSFVLKIGTIFIDFSENTVKAARSL
jgi:hypothetical protein